MGIYLGVRQSRIGIAAPTAAQIKHIIYAPYTIAAGYLQAHGIILAIAHIGEAHRTDNRGVKGTGGTQAVYAQGIVTPVLFAPLAVVYHAGRQGIEVEITYPICTHQHSTLLFVEFIHYLLQGGRRAVEVVAVELHRKTAASGAVHSLVPAAANAQIGAGGDYMHHPVVAKGIYYFRSAIGGVIIHNNYIECKGSLLPEYRFYGIAYGGCTVEHRYYHRCLNGEIAGRQIYFVVFASRQTTAYGFEMSRAGILHLYLHLALRRVHIIELLFAALAGICFLFGIKKLLIMKNFTKTAHCKAQTIKTGIGILGNSIGRIFL